MYTRVNNRARNFNFTTFTSTSLDDYLAKVYKGGGVAICGKPVFFDDFRGGRVKKRIRSQQLTPPHPQDISYKSLSLLKST